jgi:hypothetical protein
MTNVVDATLAASSAAGGVGVSVLLLWVYRFWSRGLASREHELSMAPAAMNQSIELVERLMVRVGELEAQVARLQQQVLDALDEARAARAAEAQCRADTERQQAEIDELRRVVGVGRKVSTAR